MNKFKWRYITSEDMGMLQEWWSDWNWPVSPSLDMLPQQAFLVTNTEGNIPVYAGFLYSTGTSIGWFEWIVSNKKSPVASRRGGIEYLVETVSTVAKTTGINILFTASVSPSFCNSLKKSGFVVGDTGSTQLIKKI